MALSLYGFSVLKDVFHASRKDCAVNDETECGGGTADCERADEATEERVGDSIDNRVADHDKEESQREEAVAYTRDIRHFYMFSTQKNSSACE